MAFVHQLISLLALFISLAIWPGSDPFELPKLIAASILLVGAALCRLGRYYKRNFHPPTPSSKTNHLEKGAKPLSPRRSGRKRLGIEGFELVQDSDLDGKDPTSIEGYQPRGDYKKPASPGPFLQDEPLGERGAGPSLWLPSIALLASFLISAIANGFSQTSWLGSEAGADGIWAVLVGLATIFVVAGANRTVVLSAWLAGCALAAIYGLAQRLGLDPIPWHGDNLSALSYRVFGTLGNPSFLAMLLSMAIPVGLMLAWERRGAGRFLAIAATLLVSFTLPLTMSRIGIVAGLVGLGAVWVWSRRLEPQRHSGTTLAPLACLVSILAGFLVSGIGAPESATGRFADLAEPSKGSVGVRMELYRAGIEVAMVKPLLGWGPGNTAKALHHSEQAALTERQRYNPSFHNLFLDALAQRGIIGLFATLWFLMTIWQTVAANPNRPVRIGIGFALLAFLLNSLVGFSTVGPWLSACLLIGLAKEK